MKNRLYRRILSTVLASVLVLTALSGCGGTGGGTSGVSSGESGSQASTAKKDELVVGISADPATLEPMVQSGQATRLIKQSIYRGLIAYQADNKIGMEIADSYTIADDKKTYTFKALN